MRQRKGTAYQAELIEQLRIEKKELEKEIKALENELSYKDDIIQEKEKAYLDLQEAYEKFLFTYSERIEALAEAENAHRDAVCSLRELQKQYRKEMAAQIDEVRKTIRKVV